MKHISYKPVLRLVRVRENKANGNLFVSIPKKIAIESGIKKGSALSFNMFYLNGIAYVYFKAVEVNNDGNTT